MTRTMIDLDLNKILLAFCIFMFVGFVTAIDPIAMTMIIIIFIGLLLVQAFRRISALEAAEADRHDKDKDNGDKG